MASAVCALAPAQASAETRTLKIYYVHTGERAEITFKKNGRYLPDGLRKLNIFLRDWRRNEPTKMDPRLFDLVWQVYQGSGSRDYITVVSAYRAPATNAMLRSKSSGVAKNSQHTMGRAMDYFIPGVPLKKLRYLGIRYQIGGVGYYPTSGSPFVHMDVGNVRHWPRMNRRELLAVFPDGKTVHVPTDGKPLPGYKEALASIEQRKASGGSIMMASAAPAKKSKTLFGALFGGGADEEEDISDSNSRAVAAKPARAAPVKPVAPARAPVPEAPVAAPQEVMVASLPAREVPLPMDAPRPAATIAAVPEQLPFAVAAAPAPANVLINVPVPGRKPAIAPQQAVALAAIEAKTEQTPVADDGAAAARAAVDANTMQMADAGASTAMLTGFVPVPVSRPHHEGDAVQMASAVVPGARPEPATSGQDAIAALVNAADSRVPPLPETVAEPAQQVALLAPPTRPVHSSKPSMVEELIAPPADDEYDLPKVKVTPAQRPAVVPVARQAEPQQPEAQPVRQPIRQQIQAKQHVQDGQQAQAGIGRAVNTGVRTTAKGAKPHANQALAAKAPSAILQPATTPTSELAMSNEPVSKVVPVTNPVLRNDALRAAPTMVYTAGFQRDLPTADRASSFSGNAVTFLSIAKFSKTN